MPSRIWIKYALNRIFCVQKFGSDSDSVWSDNSFLLRPSVFQIPIPMRKSLSIWPIFSDKELVDVVIVNVVVSPLLVSGVVSPGGTSASGWIACLFGFGMQGEPDVLRICCTREQVYCSSRDSRLFINLCNNAHFRSYKASSRCYILNLLFPLFFQPRIDSMLVLSFDLLWQKWNSDQIIQFIHSRYFAEHTIRSSIFNFFETGVIRYRLYHLPPPYIPEPKGR